MADKQKQMIHTRSNGQKTPILAMNRHHLNAYLVKEIKAFKGEINAVKTQYERVTLFNQFMERMALYLAQAYILNLGTQARKEIAAIKRTYNLLD